MNSIVGTLTPIANPSGVVTCKDCGATIYGAGHRRLYCVDCQDKHIRERLAETKRRRKARAALAALDKEKCDVGRWRLDRWRLDL